MYSMGNLRNEDMNKGVFNGSAQITDEGIKKHFKNFDPVQALYELIWNGLDANATKIEISIEKTALGGIERVVVRDNGSGINIQDIKNNFEKFNESSKKNDDDKHGAHGKGRLAFYKLCKKARWYTKFDDANAQITIESDAIKNFQGEYLSNETQVEFLKHRSTGTYVELLNFVDILPEEASLHLLLSKEFGWHLALNPSKSITLNDEEILVPKHKLYEKDFEIEGNKFLARVFHWEDKPSSEKSHNYLIDSKSSVVQKKLSSLNKKVSFRNGAEKL